MELNSAARDGDPHKLQGFAAISKKCKKEMKAKADKRDYKGFSADHIQDMGLNGHVTSTKNLRWMTSKMNSWIGSITGGKRFHKEYGGVDVSSCCP